MALDVPLSLLLESTDLDQEALQVLGEGRAHSSGLPPGYERVTAVLPEQRAFVVRKWAEEARQKLKGAK